MSDNFWISHPWDIGAYLKVSKADYVRAERDQGFRNSLGFADEPATAKFFGPDGISGTTFVPDNLIPVPRVFTPKSQYFDFAGRAIKIEKWMKLYSNVRGRTLRSNPLISRRIALKTMYMGFVDPLCDTTLYGTALVSLGEDGGVVELECYDSATAAYLGHLRHLVDRTGKRLSRSADPSQLGPG